MISVKMRRLIPLLRMGNFDFDRMAVGGKLRFAYVDAPVLYLLAHSVGDIDASGAFLLESERVQIDRMAPLGAGQQGQAP